MAWTSYSYGTVDIEKLFEHYSGKISYTLSDSARSRTRTGEYKWKEYDESSIIVTCGGQELVLPKKILLTYDIIVFVGLYGGDGNKGGNIGFAQREITITAFAYKMFRKIFGQSISIDWNLLEDAKRFFDESYEESFILIEKELIQEGRQLPPEGEETPFRVAYKEVRVPARKIALSKEFVFREFKELAKTVGLDTSRDAFTETVSPSKGAKTAGKSALEYIQNLKNTSKFMPVWLKIINSIIDTIIDGRKGEDNWLIWNADPNNIGPRFEIEKYCEKHVTWKTTREIKKYSNVSKNSILLTISKGGTYEVDVYKEWILSPFFLLFGGLYLAEGSTKKENIFLIGKVPLSGLSIAFTSSESRYITNFVNFLKLLGPNMLTGWKIKIGKKYSTELDILCQKRGVLPLPAGEKAQGYLRTIEVTSDLLDWAIEDNPMLDDLT